MESKHTPEASLSVADAMKIVTDAMRADPDYAWTWHCNIAMAFVDEGGDHGLANHAAARFLRTLADIEPMYELQPKRDDACRQRDELLEVLKAVQKNDADGYLYNGHGTDPIKVLVDTAIAKATGSEA